MKTKMLSLLLALALLVGLIGSVGLTAAADGGYVPFRMGDANGDGYVTTADARLILQYAAELVTEDELDVYAANVNEDEGVTTDDARLILQYAAEIIPYFPAEELTPEEILEAVELQREILAELSKVMVLPEEQVAALNAALDAAEAVAKDPNATMRERIDAAYAVVDASDMLYLPGEDDPDFPDEDIELTPELMLEMTAAMREQMALYNGMFTEASVNKFVAALDAVDAVAKDPAATDEQREEVVDALFATLEEMELRPDAAIPADTPMTADDLMAVVGLVSSMEDMFADLCTPASVAALNAALEAAQQVADNGGSQSDCVAAANNILHALMALEEI